jgi:hypothetical protein
MDVRLKVMPDYRNPAVPALGLPAVAAKQLTFMKSNKTPNSLVAFDVLLLVCK